MSNPSQEVRGATLGVAVTKSDSTDLGVTRAIYVGGAGDLHVRFIDLATTVVFTSVPAGTTLPLQVNRVMNATTATNIVALY
jgi:hypothetical protein